MIIPVSILPANTPDTSLREIFGIGCVQSKTQTAMIPRNKFNDNPAIQDPIVLNLKGWKS